MNSSPPDESPIDAQLANPPTVTESSPTYQKAAGGRDFVQNRGAVLAILFLVTGFLGLPLLWMNKQFSSAERILWSIVVTIYTLALIAIAAAIVWWAYTRIFP